MSFFGSSLSAGVLFDKGDLPKIMETFRAHTARFERDYRGEIFAARMPFDRLDRTLIGQDLIATFGEGIFLPDVQCRNIDRRMLDRSIDADTGQSFYVRGRVIGTFAGVLHLDGCLLR